MALVLISPPPVEPVTLAEMKQALRVDTADTSQDSFILDLVMQARSFVERETKRQLVAATWQLLLDFFPGYIDLKLAGAKVSSPFVSGSNAVLVGIRYALEAPFPPVNSISSFSYQDANGNVTQMVEGTNYIKDLLSNPARLTPPFGQMWPVARVVVNAVQITFICGYAMPIIASLPSPPVYNQIQAATYQFQSSDVGRPISIPNGGPSGGTLNTVISAVTSPPSTTATLRDPIAVGATVAGVTALLVNAPAGRPDHWYTFKSAIRTLVTRWYEIRVPDEKDAAVLAVKKVLWGVGDRRF